MGKVHYDRDKVYPSNANTKFGSQEIQQHDQRKLGYNDHYTT